MLSDADAGSRTRLVLQWQHDYGNGFVQRVVGEKATGSAAPSKPSKAATHRPHLTWRATVKPGGEAPGEARDASRLFKGDHLRISVIFPPLPPDHKEAIDFPVMAASPGWGIDVIGWEKNAYVWDVTTLELGHYKLPIWSMPRLITTPEWAREYHDFEFSIVADFPEFLRSCQSAALVLGEKFSLAVKTVNDATAAYRAAFHDQQEALNRVAAAEKMEDEMKWAAFMAVLMGPIGSLGKLVSEARKFKNFSEIAKEGVYELSKELSRFTTESLHKLGEKGGELEGPRKPTGSDPLEFLVNFSSQLADESAINQKRLRTVIDAAGRARDKKRGIVFDQDPERMVEQDTQIATTQKMPIQMSDYLRQLWAEWLRHYAWEPEEHQGSMGSLEPHYWKAENRINKKIRRELERAASICADKADDWIAKWAPEAKLGAEQEAEEFTREEAAWYHNTRLRGG